MRAFKVVGMALAFFVLARYFPVLYYTSQFNDFVKHEPQRMPLRPQLQQNLLQQAAIYFLPIRADDIRIKEDGDLIRVNVDYRVPVNFFIFTYELSFHATGAGLAAH